MKSEFNVRALDIVFTRKSAEVGSKVMKCNARSTPWKLIDKDLNESRGGNIKRLSGVELLCVGPTGLSGKERKDVLHVMCSTLIGNLRPISHSSSRMKN